MENIVCDKCNNEFRLEAKDIKTKAIDEVLITVSFFECPHCQHKYITSCIDSYIMKEQRRYTKLNKNIESLKALRYSGVFTYKHQGELIELKANKLKCLRNMKLHSDTLKLKIKDKL